MFSKRSRYYRLAETLHPDRKGINRSCKVLRRVPTLQGQFQHMLEASDRLDHLAYKYYRQSLHWWRICDANPQFYSPRELLDKTVVVPLRVVLAWSAPLPPWAGLFNLLRKLPGVQGLDKHPELNEELLQIADGAPLFELPIGLSGALNDAVRTQVFPPALDTALQADGLVLNGPLRFSRPLADVWQIQSLVDGNYYRLHAAEGPPRIVVNRAELEYRLELTIHLNRAVSEQAEVLLQIEGMGFEILDDQAQTRIGERILIPPRYTGKG